jgi:pyruvate formate lyase activating enzyme
MTIAVSATITKGIVFDIKKYATDDGPGIRTTIFFKGCPLRCSWCHNPEGQVSTPQLMYRERRCIQCGECEKACMKQVIMHSTERMLIYRDRCNLCGECTQKCPTDSLRIIGKEMDLSEVVKEIEKDRLFYDQSKGGVTISGGEPLMQLDFLREVLRECKAKNIHIAVDTCGYAPREALDKIIDKVDIFLYDIKMIDDRKHLRYTGASNKSILENFERLGENGSSILVRFPVIPGVNDDEENIKNTAQLMLLHGKKDIHLLPYHRAGIEKYKSLGMIYRLKRIQPPSDEKLMSIKEQLENFGLKVTIGGG